jgi:thioesterase domain-containing protein
MGWGELVRGGVEVRICPGDHATILEPLNIAETARQLEAALQTPLAKTG